MKADTHIAAIVLAAGFSSRMGKMKALLPLAGTTVMGHLIDGLRQVAGGPVILVTGHCADAVEEQATRLQAQPCRNTRYADGMFSSVLAGVRMLAGQKDTDAFFLLPVDYPRVSVETLHLLAHEFKRSKAPVTYPSYCGQSGHPPLIRADVMPHILKHSGKDGLRGALAAFDSDSVCVDVENAAILDDLDTPTDYERAVRILDHTYEYRHFFLQGEIGIGKSTLLHKYIKSHREEMGGFAVSRGYENGRCRRFVLQSVQESLLPPEGRTPEAKRVFLREREDGWEFFPQVFEEWCVNLLTDEQEKGFPLFLLDEIGGVESQCPMFSGQISRLLAEKRCMGVLKHRRNSEIQANAMREGKASTYARGKLVKQIVRTGGRIVTLTEQNRDEAGEQLRRFLSTVRK
ncbi:NTP transferase domain-containing protein [Christensenellaceae bacterium OttesenSCG-928-K19]|nr:NTP transferase domain-containing protein [Christensenellaceae bacterium OttesenSCG-928-K19]